MKILTVCSSWRVFGAETITLKMLDGFKQRGHEQIAITSIWTDGEMSRHLQQLGIREEVMPFGAVVASLSPKYLKWTADVVFRLPILWWRWRRLMRQFQPDVIIWTSSKQAMLLLPWLDERPSFLMEFTNMAPTKNIQRLYARLSKKLAGFVAVSDFMRTHLHSVGAPLKNITVVKSGAFFEADRMAAECNAIRAVRNAKELARVGIIGQVAPNKGHDCLVEAVSLLRRQGINLIVRTFGSGESGYTERLKKKIQKAGLADIWEWMGYEQDKLKIFAAIDICIVPSCFGDPFPTVAMEAGVYGLPVVASRIGGLPEIIEDSVTGWLVEPDSPEQLAEKIQYLINQPEAAREMGKAGRERVFKLFTVEKMVMKFESLFEEFVPPAHE
jgi:glycosyltransferase involved in cell wall biosynthesis